MRWNEEIAKKLDQTDFGILCLTPENRNAPWIHFEAGALAKKVDKARVCPYLLGLKTTDIKGPLESFQAKNAEKEDTRDIVKEINNALGKEALSAERLDRAFDVNWPRLEKTLKEILENTQTINEPSREPDDMLEEILEIVREQSRILSDAVAPSRFESLRRCLDQNNSPMSEAELLKCPICNFDCQHFTVPEQVPGEDNYKAWHGRGDLIRIPFWGECDHNWNICIGHHKGQSVAFVEEDDQNENPMSKES